MTGDRRRKEQSKKSKEEENGKRRWGRRRKAEKVCAFHFILCGSTDLVCFGIAISNLGLRRGDKKTEKMARSGKTTQDELMKWFKFS